MRRSFAGLIILLMLAVLSAGASGAEKISVAVVNIDKVINESLAGQGANRVLLQLIKERQGELNQIAEDINKLQKELEKKDTAEMRQQLNQLVNEYQQKVAEANNIIQTEAQQMRNELVGEIQEITLKLGDDKKYSLIIDSPTITYYTRTNIIDTTGEIVRRYNDLRNGS